MANFVTYTIKQNDTILDIAQAITGSADNWTSIVLVNNLDFPYIDDGSTVIPPGYNVKKAGDSLLIPADSVVDQSLIPSFDHTDIYAQALGSDLQLFPNNPVTLIYTDGGEFTSNTYGDLSVVSGIQNLRQALIIKLSTPLGSLLYHPDFGTRVGDYLGKPGITGALQKIEVEVLRTIRTDSRVQDVQITSSVLSGNAAQIGLQIQPVGFDVAFQMRLAYGQGGLLEWD